MKRVQILVLLLCATISFCELLGPDSKARDKKQTEDEPAKTLDPDNQADPEYLKDIDLVVNQQILELKNFMALSAEKNKERLDKVYNMYHKLAGIQENSNQVVELKNLLKEYDGIKHKFIHEIDSEFLPTWNPEEIPGVEDMSADEIKISAKEIFEDTTLKLRRRTISVSSAILKVMESADMGYIPAKIKMAWFHLFGEDLEINVEKATKIFTDLAEVGIADGHAGLGFIYATGIGVPVSQAKALVHFTIGAIGGSTYAQMAMAYRYWSGATIPNSCGLALELYMKVASKVAESVTLNGGPAVQRSRLLDEMEGSGATPQGDRDLIEYYQLLAEKGDVDAQVGLGQLHFQGGRGVTMDILKAHHYFSQAAKTGNAVANALLGKIYLEGGDGIKVDDATALLYFRRAAELNNPVGQSGLGLMYLQGRGVPQDTGVAFKYFTMAANQGWVEGQLHLGFMYFGGIGMRRDFKQAMKYFSLASQSGHVLAFYYLAHMHAQGAGVSQSCSTAVELAKNVCERGHWSDGLMRSHTAWRDKNPHSSYLQYLSLAEMGYEVAQSNAAYLLDSGEVKLYNDTERYIRALQLWGRAAAQGYSAARVKLGDYHYYGLGTKVDYEAAAHHYRIASEQQHNAQATFNLGYMHSLGLGLARDPHLAKRCYDLAADTAPEARLPSALALAALHATSLTQVLLTQTPIAILFLTGDSPLLQNWDVYLIAVLVSSLGIVLYFRRPRP